MNEKNVPAVKQFPLERTKILKKFIVSEIGYGILFGFLFFVSIFLSFLGDIQLILTVGVVGLFLLVSIVNFWYQTEYYNKYYYDTDDSFLVIKKGVFMPRETTLPFEKLQDVYLDQDLFDRIFNLWDLHVSTATFMSGMEAHLDGLNKENGEAMKQILLEKIKQKE